MICNLSSSTSVLEHSQLLASYCLILQGHNFFATSTLLYSTLSSHYHETRFRWRDWEVWFVTTASSLWTKIVSTFFISLFLLWRYSRDSFRSQLLGNAYGRAFSKVIRRVRVISDWEKKEGKRWQYRSFYWQYSGVFFVFSRASEDTRRGEKSQLLIPPWACTKKKGMRIKKKVESSGCGGWLCIGRYRKRITTHVIFTMSCMTDALAGLHVVCLHWEVYTWL